MSAICGWVVLWVSELAKRETISEVKQGEWSRDMNQRELMRDLKSLPPEAQREVIDFIAFLRARYKAPFPSEKLKRTELALEPFVGMWRDREEMEDSSRWVRSVREREWSTS